MQPALTVTDEASSRPMPVFLLKRLLTLLITLAVASAVVFAVLELLPGNAA